MERSRGTTVDYEKSSHREESDVKRTKVYCANCKHCKVTTEALENGKYRLRVRCDAGKWKKKLGDEKLYKYFTVVRRSFDFCDMYEPMGDEKEFLKQLKKTLPIKDEVYTRNEIKNKL